MKLLYMLNMAFLTGLFLPITHYSAYAAMEVDTTVDVKADSANAARGKSYDLLTSHKEILIFCLQCFYYVHSDLITS